MKKEKEKKKLYPKKGDEVEIGIPNGQDSTLPPVPRTLTASVYVQAENTEDYCAETDPPKNKELQMVTLGGPPAK